MQRAARNIGFLVALLLIREFIGILVQYRWYFPPDFELSNFLAGRQSFFYGSYKIAFYLHIASGPVAILLGTFLYWSGRQAYRTSLHRQLGKLQFFLVTIVLAPSGLILATRTHTGLLAGIGFALLSVLTLASTVLLLFHIKIGNLIQHQLWATRLLILLLSPLLLRMMAMAAEYLALDPESSYQFGAWTSWLVPLNFGDYFDGEVEHDGTTYPAYPAVDAKGYPLWNEQRLGMLCPGLPNKNSEFGSVHYAFSIGDVARDVHDPKAIRGAFAVGLTLTLDEIIDGTSNTVALLEIGGSGTRSVGRRFAVNQSEKYLWNPSLTSELVNRWGKYKQSVALSERERGGNWADGTGGPGLVNTILPAGSPNLLVGEQSAVDGLFSASVNHAGGTVSAFCDGATVFISADIDVGDQKFPTNSAEDLVGIESHYGIWGSLGSSNGHENNTSRSWSW